MITEVSYIVLKKSLLSISLVILLLLSLDINQTHAEDNLIIRKILTGVSWSKGEEGTIIKADYVEVRKVGDQATTHDENTRFIDATDLKYKNLDKKKVEEYLEESGSDHFVYHEDLVYGNYLKIFADVSNKNIEKEELDTLINKAINEVNNFYEKRDKIISGEIALPSSQQEQGNEQNPYYLWVVSTILALLGISILMKILNIRKK